LRRNPSLAEAARMEDVADRFARALMRAAGTPFPGPLDREAKRSLLNVLGLAIGAAGHLGADAIVAAAGELGGPARATIPGRAERVDPLSAALATGFAAHVDDFDDTHLATVIHPGAAALGVLAGLAPATAPTGAQALVAFALGCEAQLRAGVAISPEHYDRGWHITGTCGVVGAAVAAALLLELDEPALARALRLATTMTLGHRESFGTMVKAFHPGKAAANGISAALFGRVGLDGPAGAFEARGGFGDALSSRFDARQMLDGLGERWELLANTYKPYPCGIVAHPAIDAALALAPRLGAPAAILSIDVHCHPLVAELMGNPQPSDDLEARFSAIHGVAAALCDGRVGLAQYETARVRRAAVGALRAKTALRPDAGIARDEARIEVLLADGSQLTEHVLHARGSLARPLTDEELFEKFAALVEPRLGAAAVVSLAAEVRRIERIPAFAELLAASVPRPAHV
jgi:2-methylcitrate dehydratase PrpD